MTPEQERTARVVGLLNEMLAVLPPASAQLHMSPEEIRRREARALELGDEMNRLTWPT